MTAHALALAVEVATTVLTVAGMSYFAASMVAARLYAAQRGRPRAASTAGVSVLKSLKGMDPGMLEAFRTHCRQEYTGEFELLFGVSRPEEPAAEAVRALKREFPERAIKLIVCPLRLGANGKVSTLAQMAGQARYDVLLVNDSDITVGPHYLERVMAEFGPDTRKEDAQTQRAQDEGARKSGSAEVGLVTALYRGRAHGSLLSHMEALGIATDFQAGVLLSRMLEGGMRFGLGSTLAVRREALEKMGGFEALVDYLADDYELGARVAQSGYRVALCAEVVETSVPAYGWRGFAHHQLRWLRTVRDARPAGYAGLVFTHGLGWALVNVVASGLSPLSLWLLSLAFFLRLAQAMTVGAGVLSDRQVLPWLWLLPARDAVAMGLWAAGFAGNEIVWRGERFEVKDGRLRRLTEPGA